MGIRPRTLQQECTRATGASHRGKGPATLVVIVVVAAAAAAAVVSDGTVSHFQNTISSASSADPMLYASGKNPRGGIREDTVPLQLPTPYMLC